MTHDDNTTPPPTHVAAYLRHLSEDHDDRARLASMIAQAIGILDGSTARRWGKDIADYGKLQTVVALRHAQQRLCDHARSSYDSGGRVCRYCEVPLDMEGC